MISKRLTIFEGPDGSGKSTAARQYAADTGAQYVHFGPFKGLKSISRFYVEAMMPAVLGHKDVVFDRSWYSEMPYGRVFRNGENRIPPFRVRQLERLASRCQTMVVSCRTSLSKMMEAFESRPEMLANVQQLDDVTSIYDNLEYGLPFFNYNYAVEAQPRIWDNDRIRTLGHHLGAHSAGDLDAPILIVGQDFGNHAEDDALYQWPFGSTKGSSRFITEHLMDHHIPEGRLCWVNADELSESFFEDSRRECKHIIALGAPAADVLRNYTTEFHKLPHPANWSRFHSTEPYALGPLILDLTVAP